MSKERIPPPMPKELERLAKKLEEMSNQRLIMFALGEIILHLPNQSVDCILIGQHLVCRGEEEIGSE